MLISCKVSNSILYFMERQGRDLSGLFQAHDIPEEFLRDPSCWLEAAKMETLLAEIDSQFHDVPDDYFRDIGKQSEQQRAWGVLDSVLKMVESPLDIYCQPSRFISYFISPEPPIASWKQEGEKMSFHLPIMAEQYPFITSYLSGALEGLPLYMRQPPGVVTWLGSHIQIVWRQTQENLLSDEDLQLRQFNPQWVRTMMESLEKHQKNLEQKNTTQELAGISSSELSEIQNFLAETQKQFEFFLNETLSLKNDFLKLHDYFVRSQQLITFLVHAGRKTKQVDEAMRRVDWKHVQSSYEEMVESACERILGNKVLMQKLAFDFQKFKTIEDKKEDSESLHLPI